MGPFCGRTRSNDATGRGCGRGLWDGATEIGDEKSLRTEAVGERRLKLSRILEHGQSPAGNSTSRPFYSPPRVAGKPHFGTLRRPGEVAELVESAPLLRVYRLIPYRGFESLPLRHFCDGSCDRRDFPHKSKFESEDGPGKARKCVWSWRLRSADSEPETRLFREFLRRLALLFLRFGFV